MVKIPYVTLFCKKLDNVKVSTYNTTHKYKALPNDYYFSCLKIIQHVFLTDILDIDTNGKCVEFKIFIPFSSLEKCSTKKPS